MVFPLRTRNKAVREAFNDVFNEEELEKALCSVDVIGDLAVIKLPRCWEGRGNELGELVLNQLNHVRGVFRQTTPACRGERLRGLEWLAGKRETVTTYREHGCDFNVDIAKVYFSPRLSHERLRIARLAKPGEIVVNMFAGVGTFSIIMAKTTGVAKIYSIDINEEAFKFQKENATINKVANIVIPILGDSKEVTGELKGVADRVLMPLPELAYEYIQFAMPCLRSRGWIHVYTHQKAESKREALEIVSKKIADEVLPHGKLLSIFTHIVRSVGRRQFQVVADTEVERRS